MNLRYSPVLQGIKASVKSMFSPPNSESADDEEVDRVIDTDDDGNQLYKEDIIANIHEELEKRRSARSAGKQTDIEIDFRKTEIRALVKVLPWGEVEQETEM